LKPAVTPSSKRRIWSAWLDHAILMSWTLVAVGPVLMALVTSTHEAVTIHRQGLQWWPGDQAGDVYRRVLTEPSGFSGAITGWRMLWNSAILGVGFAVGKIIISLLSAYAIVYFRVKGGVLIFWLIFTTLLLPLEVRIIPTYEVVHTLGLSNSYTGLILPLIASATATFYFRQFLLTVPDELHEAARIDGAGPWKFLVDILLPLSRNTAAAIFIIMFVTGWNQYLWPTLITTDEHYFTLVRGIKQILQVWVESDIPHYAEAMALTVLALFPPMVLVLVFQRWFIRGLTESGK
jgi:sn-glycerol 3-phosphate transport system permease protein